MKKLLKNPAVIITVVAIFAIVVGIYSYNSLTKQPKYDYSKAVTKDITESVSLTGQVKAAQDVSLAFERAGKVVWTPVAVGDKVYAGQALASLNSQDAQADLASAKASLALAQAQAGIQGTQVDNAKSALSQAQKAMSDKIQSAYTASDDAVRTQSNQFFSNPAGDNPTLVFSIPDQQLTGNIQNERRNLEATLTNWDKEIQSISSGATNYEALSGHARQNLLAVKAFLDDVASALNIAVGNSGQATASNIATWKASVTISRNTISGALSSLSSADSALTANESVYALAQQQVQSGSVTSVSQAQVDAAQANVDRANSALSKTVIRAPFDGIVSKMDAKVGQTVSVGTPLVGLISNANYQIEGYVSESDAAKISVGQMASTTLDAYGSAVSFPVKVVLVDPAATMQNGVSAYKVTFQFIGNDIRVKSGMTANVSVFIAWVKQALTVPASAIVRRGAEDFVLVAETKNSGAVLRKVTLGVTGDDGSVQVLEGVTPYDLVVSLTNSK